MVVNTYNAIVDFVTKITYIRIFVGLLFTFLSMLFSLPVKYFGKLLMLFNVMKTVDSLGGLTGNGKRDDEKVKSVHKLWILYSVLNLANYVATTYLENYIGEYTTNLFIMFVYYAMLNNSANLVGGCIDFSTRFYAVNIVIMNRYIELISGGCKFALNTTSDASSLCINVFGAVKKLGFTCGCYKRVFTCATCVTGLCISLVNKLKNMRKKERAVVSTVDQNTDVAESETLDMVESKSEPISTVTEFTDLLPDEAAINNTDSLSDVDLITLETFNVRDVEPLVKQSEEVISENNSKLDDCLATLCRDSPKLVVPSEYVTYEDELDETF